MLTRSLGQDTVDCGECDDLDDGKGGNDHLMGGGRGRDRLSGRDRRDLLDRGRGHALLRAGEGSDVLVISLGRSVAKDYNLGGMIQCEEEIVSSNYSLLQSREGLVMRMSNSAGSIMFQMARSSLRT